MKLLVLQYEPLKTLGVFHEFLAEDGHQVDLHLRKEGTDLPDLNAYEGLWVFGVHADLDAPWIAEDIAFIREATFERGLPYLGVGLGHLMLAKALGGTVETNSPARLGIGQLQLTQAGASGVFLDGLEENFTAIVSQAGRITGLPSDVQCLVVNESDNPVQTMKWETRAHSTQFHFELCAADIQTLAAESTLAIDDVAALCTAIEAQATNFEQNAERLYINWLQTSAQT